MSQSIEKFKLLENIKLSYLKHRGNVLEVAKELGLPIDYVKKNVVKIKKKQKRDVATLISNNITQHILLGYESRIRNLMDILKKLEGRDQLVVSVCCEVPVENHKEEFKCVSCNKKCKTKIIDNEEIVDLKLGILEQLREEDRALVEFAGKMGYTNKEDPEPTPSIKQNFVVLPGGGEGNEISKKLNEIGGIEAHVLINKLRREIIDIDAGEAGNENEQQNDT